MKALDLLIICFILLDVVGTLIVSNWHEVALYLAHAEVDFKLKLKYTHWIWKPVSWNTQFISKWCLSKMCFFNVLMLKKWLLNTPVIYTLYILFSHQSVSSITSFFLILVFSFNLIGLWQVCFFPFRFCICFCFVFFVFIQI